MDNADNIRRIKDQAKLPKEKKKYSIPKKSAKKIQQEKKEAELLKTTNELGQSTGIPSQEQWFKDRMAENVPVCMNCGMTAPWLLEPKYEKIWRACQAHILPKREAQFPSVATHPLNHLVLFPVWGGYLCGCHDEYDSGWFSATTMDVWPKANERFKQFESAIAEKEKRKIPEQFLK
jgi:hypothetical protein